MLRSRRLPAAAAAAALCCTIAPVTLAANTPKKKCTAAQRQALIDEGRYDQAIHEFSSSAS